MLLVSMGQNYTFIYACKYIYRERESLCIYKPLMEGDRVIVVGVSGSVKPDRLKYQPSWVTAHIVARPRPNIPRTISSPKTGVSRQAT